MSKTLEELGYKLIDSEYDSIKVEYHYSGVAFKDTKHPIYFRKEILISEDNYVSFSKKQSYSNNLDYILQNDSFAVTKEELEAVLKIMEERENNESDNDVD